ncbi:MAG: class II aldolase/adducin family protein [Candidatus Riflebacteria bacterium]|nr:class II aldolase/adducin family protein [Candidatus Riflebacteria bacterium]MBR4570104.1 class II aldolase/adducin family protein [Candidatus Riflebacteria bacterium]
MFLNEFRQVGTDLFIAGLNNSHSGNLSIRLDDEKMIITRTGCMLHHIDHPDLITTSIGYDDYQTLKASRELPVHRSIYLNTNAKSIVHAHSPHVVAESLNGRHIENDRLMLIDAEGLYYFAEGIPVIEAQNAIASDEVAELVIPALKTSKIVIVKGHGVFSIGETLEEAYHWVAGLEHSVKILRLALS